MEKKAEDYAYNSPVEQMTIFSRERLAFIAGWQEQDKEIERLKGLIETGDAVEVLEWVLKNHYRVDVLNNGNRWVQRQAEGEADGFWREVTSEQLYKLWREKI